MASRYLQHPDSGVQLKIPRRGGYYSMTAPWFDQHDYDVDYYTNFVIPYAAKPFIAELKKTLNDKVYALHQQHDPIIREKLKRITGYSTERIREIKREYPPTYDLWLSKPKAWHEELEAGKEDHPDGPLYALALCGYNWPAYALMSRELTSEHVGKIQPLLRKLHKQVEMTVEKTIREEIKKRLNR